MTTALIADLPVDVDAEGFLTHADQWNEEIAAAIARFEATAPADPLVMFDHVYAELPPELKAQRETLAETLRSGEPGRREKHEPSPPMRGQRSGRR